MTIAGAVSSSSHISWIGYLISAVVGVLIGIVVLVIMALIKYVRRG